MASVSASNEVLRVEHLTVRFGGLTAVNDLDFVARHGDITGLIGPNGAGKTTVFNCITGFYKPTTGLLTMTHPGGAQFYLDRMADFRVSSQARVARTFQNIRLFSGMTVLENLLVAQHNVLMKASGMSVFGVFGLPVYRTAEEQAKEKAAWWLNKIGLYDRADDPAGELPYGAQRRLEIARAMCTEPVLLCLDEPAAGLNPRESAELNDLLISIRSDLKTAILLIEHDMSVVMKICDHIVVLEYGQKISDGTPDEVKADPRVIAAYLGVEDSEIEAKPEVASLIEEAGAEIHHEPEPVARTAPEPAPPPEPKPKPVAPKAAAAGQPAAKKPAAKKPATKKPAAKAAAAKKPAAKKGGRT